MKTITISKPGPHQHTLDQPGEYEFVLTVPEAEVSIVGSFAARNKDKVEVAVIIRHKSPHTRAETTLKGVADDKAQVKFTGRIIIEKDCGNSNSFLTERILLLSDEAKAEAIPDLEILTDDVKCSHAASISRIPEEHLFYLQSRGITRKQAEKMIVEGFLRV